MPDNKEIKTTNVNKRIIYLPTILSYHSESTKIRLRINKQKRRSPHF